MKYNVFLLIFCILANIKCTDKSTNNNNVPSGSNFEREMKIELSISDDTIKLNDTIDINIKVTPSWADSYKDTLVEIITIFEPKERPGGEIGFEFPTGSDSSWKDNFGIDTIKTYSTKLVPIKDKGWKLSVLSYSNNYPSDECFSGAYLEIVEVIQ